MPMIFQFMAYIFQFVVCSLGGEREREREAHFLSWQGPWKGRTHCESIVVSLILHLQMHLQEADYMI